MLEKIDVTDTETRNFIIHNLDSFILKQESRLKNRPVLDLDRFMKKILESYYKLINDHYISDHTLVNFRKQLSQTIADGNYLSWDKLEVFTRKQGLSKAIKTLLMSLSNSASSNHSTSHDRSPSKAIVADQLKDINKRFAELKSYEKKLVDHEQLLLTHENKMLQYLTLHTEQIKKECMQTINSKLSFLEEKIDILNSTLTSQKEDHTKHGKLVYPTKLR